MLSSPSAQPHSLSEDRYRALHWLQPGWPRRLRLGRSSCFSSLTFAQAVRAVVYSYCTRVLYPAYAKQFRAAAFDDFAAVYYSRRRLVSLLYMLAIGGIIGMARLLVDLLYDPRYAGVAPLLQIVAISVMLLLNNVAAEQAMVAADTSQVTLHPALSRVVWLAIADFSGFWAVGTIEVVATGY